jgi:hypothetical protein
MTVSQSQPVLTPRGHTEAEPSAAFAKSVWRHLDNLQHRQTGRDPKTNGYAYAEVPDWTLRQWLAKAEALVALIAAAREISAVLSRFGDWEDGCFYYNGTTASELEGPQQALADAIEKALGPSAQDTSERSDRTREGQKP